jgi:hypothetical protein
LRVGTCIGCLLLSVTGVQAAARQPAEVTAGYSVFHETYHTYWLGVVAGGRTPSWHHLALMAESSLHNVRSDGFSDTRWALSGGVSLSTFRATIAPELHVRAGFEHEWESELGGPYRYSDTHRAREAGVSLRLLRSGRLQPLLGFDIRWVRYVYVHPGFSFPYWEKRYVFNVGIAFQLRPPR